MWIRKPTPVTTESMVRDRPSSTKVETDVEVTDRHPVPQRHAVGLTSIVKEIDTRIRCHQRSQTD